MKLMKLGSKPGDGENISELASDITVKVGNVKFHLHQEMVLLFTQVTH